MTRTTKLASVAAVVVAGIALSGYGLWWMMRQPMYSPGDLAQIEIDARIVLPDSLYWEVEPGIKLARFAVGEGDNVLVIHGGPGIPQIESAPGFDLLGDAYRFHYYAQRGTGESHRPTFDFTGSQWNNIQQLEGALGIGQQLADIERVRRLLGDERLIIVGHSYGALLAVLYAAELPDRIRGLILLAPADLVVFPSSHGGLFGNLRDRLPEAERVAYDAWLREYLDLAGIFTATEAELLDLDAGLVRYFEAAIGDRIPAGISPPADQIGVWHARAQYFSMGFQHDYSRALGAITAPTLIVHGGDDLQPLAVSEDYEHWIPTARVVTVEGSGHFPHYTHGTDLAPIVRQFLDGLN